MTTAIVTDNKDGNKRVENQSQDAQSREEEVTLRELHTNLATADGSAARKKPPESEKQIPPLFVDIVQAAQLTGISKSTINRWIQMDPPAFPSVKLGGMRLFALEELAEWCRRVSAEKRVPPHRLAQITRQLFDELNRQVFPSGQRGRSSSSSSGQHD